MKNKVRIGEQNNHALQYPKYSTSYRASAISSARHQAAYNHINIAVCPDSEVISSYHNLITTQCCLDIDKHAPSKVILQFTITLGQSYRSKANYNDAFVSYGIHYLKLTAREIQCLQLISDGLRSKEIARQLSISYRTVEKHIENVKVKLDCKTIVEAISYINRCVYEHYL